MIIMIVMIVMIVMTVMIVMNDDRKIKINVFMYVYCKRTIRFDTIMINNILLYSLLLMML